MCRPEDNLKTHDPTRRSAMSTLAGAAGAALLSGRSWISAAASALDSQTSKEDTYAAHRAWSTTRNHALEVVSGNVQRVNGFGGPVLFEGSTYKGIWQECGPQESLVFASLREVPASADAAHMPLSVARNSHMAFFSFQREDGQLPASIKPQGPEYGQIQMAVPIAATAWELSQRLQNEEFLKLAYNACSRWDHWLRRYRDTRKTGLVEGFCTYDTGQDNSPRWRGIPNRCPDADARRCPQIASMPRLCPDLSATVYGGRIALASMAAAMGKAAEEQRWKDDAEKIRGLIIEKLYSPEDGSFYDLDAQDRFVRVRSVVNCRVMGEHVLRREDTKEKGILEDVWRRQLHDPAAFWAPFPLTSIAQNDPSFVRPIPRNSWGGASQALTALRAPRWMDFYGKQKELRFLMTQWCEAFVADGDFRQQMDPQTGLFTRPDPGGYSPSALVFLSFAERLEASGNLRDA